MRKKGLRDWGGTLAADQAHHIAVGAETLALRMTRQCENAQALAEYLVAPPEGQRRPFSRPARASGTRARDGAVPRARRVAVVRVGRRACDVVAMLNRLRVVVLSSNLGDNRTLAIPVAQTIFWEMGAARRAEMGIADSLVRVSVGIEDSDDLIADFAQRARLTRRR